MGIAGLSTAKTIFWKRSGLLGSLRFSDSEGPYAHQAREIQPGLREDATEGRLPFSIPHQVRQPWYGPSPQPRGPAHAV